MTQENMQRPSRKALTKLSKEIYATGMELNLQQTLTTVYRPVYGALDRVLEWVPPGAKLLDIGCGTGILLFLASSLGRLERGWGFDPKTASIEVARSVDCEVEIDFEESERAPTRLIEGADTITLVDLMHHVPDDEKQALLDHYLGNARAETRVILKDLDTRPLWRALANRVTDYISTRSSVYYMSMPDARKALEAAGFEIVHSERWYNYVWCEYLFVARKRASEEAGGAPSRVAPKTGP